MKGLKAYCGNGDLAQSGRAFALHVKCRGFESLNLHHNRLLNYLLLCKHYNREGKNHEMNERDKENKKSCMRSKEPKVITEEQNKEKKRKDFILFFGPIP
tara:strand:+ start:3150 stop:3449 length:300 start_codon:yes stop_codon:yes gene_type:complete